MSTFPSGSELLQFALDHRGYVYRPAFLAVLIWAVIKGAAPERIIAVIFTTMFVTGRIYRSWSGEIFAATGVDLWSAGMDTFLAISLVAVALHANRIYPLWLAGLQLICLLAHLARAVAPDIDLLAYAILVVAPAYGQLVVFALGMRAHRRRVALHGSYPPWRSSSFLSRANALKS